MVKKLFALASVTALTGLVSAVSAAGCSSTTDPPGAAPADAGIDAKKADAKSPVPDTEEPPPDPTCLAPDPIDQTKVPYKSPSIKVGACNADSLTAIDNLVKSNPQATFDDLKAALSATCAACVFGDDSAATWAPIVESGGKVVALNSGGCVAIVSGKDACGKAYQQWDACLGEACTSCTDTAAKQQCSQDAQQDGAACGAATKALADSCGNNVNAYISACFKGGELTIKGPITKQCIEGAPKDAGGG